MLNPFNISQKDVVVDHCTIDAVESLQSRILVQEERPRLKTNS